MTVVGIAGGTGAGKTTLTRKLMKALGGSEHVSVLVHDCYYHTMKDRDSTANFDHPDALETSLLIEHIRALKRGKCVQVPKYDFSKHVRTDETETVEPKPVLLVEGILVFCDTELTKEMDIKVFVVSSMLGCLLNEESIAAITIRNH